MSGMPIAWINIGRRSPPRKGDAVSLEFSRAAMRLVWGGQHVALAALMLSSTVAAAADSCPLASAGGPYLGQHNQPILLNASGSTDPQGWTLKYSWDTNGDGIFGDTIGVMPSVTYSAPGTYGIGVIVTDAPPADANYPACSKTSFSTVVVGNISPVAKAGGGYIGSVNVPLLLDGTGSYDPDGDKIFYAWDLSGKGFFADSTLPSLVSTFASPGQYVVGLQVSDEYGKSSENFTTVTILGTVLEPSTLTLTLSGLLSIVGLVSVGRSRV
jgi:hypothetical protein